MSSLNPFRGLTADQRNAFAACFLGWTLDAFDFFILVFVIKDVAKDFHTDKTRVAIALMLTLALRPVGAFLFGLAADKYGRRLPLMVDVILFSILELLSGFAPNLTIFLVLRALFGIAMGGEWGMGASLAMETVPAEKRGLLSGLLQEGYVIGYLLAAVLYPLVFPALGWRWMFFIGALPAALSLFIRSHVKESPVWLHTQAEKASLATTRVQPAEPLAHGTTPAASLGSQIQKHIGLFGYLILLMTAFTFMSHGTQDIYPTFLQSQRHFGPGVVSAIVITYNVGALLGGIFFGSLSQRIGRRKAIVIAALVALPIIPLWAYSHTAVLLAIGGFLMQFMVQGAWGIIPAHLSELAPNVLRGTFTGLAYQLGNLLSSVNAPLQTKLAEQHHGDFALILSCVAAVALLSTAIITALGKEAKGAVFENRE